MAKRTHKKLLEQLRREGYVRVRVDGAIRILADDIILEKTKHTIEVVVDRIIIKEGITKRLTDSVETALRLGNGMVIVNEIGGRSYVQRSFRLSGMWDFLPKPEPRIFSFNNPLYGMSACTGLGSSLEVDFDA